MKLIVDIPDEMYEAIKSGMWCGSHELEIAIRNGTPIQTVTNAEEAKAYQIISKEEQAENCRIIQEFLRDVAQAKDLPMYEE